MNNAALQQEALTRAVSSQSFSNYVPIMQGFIRKGIPESEIKPRENVFTYNAWKALGRQVRKGEHGVRCLTFIVQRDKRTGREEKRPWSTTVFHISQTDAVGAKTATAPRYPVVPMFDALDNAKEHQADLDAMEDDLSKPDATAENIPYAGEADLNDAELQAHSDAVHASRGQLPDATPENVPFAGEDAASRESGLDDAIAAHIQRPLLPLENLPYDASIEPAAPKDSAYDRAMRGETVSIMDIIDELKDEPKPAPRVPTIREYQARIQRPFQTKTVDF